jgi:hypothetical protein
MATAAVVFKGASMTFGSTLLVAQLESIEGVGYKSDAVDVTHSLSPNNTCEFVGSGLHGGTVVSMNILFNPGTDPQTIVGVAAALVITWSNAKIWTNTLAVCTGYTGGGKIGDKGSGKVTFQPSGVWTLS